MKTLVIGARGYIGSAVAQTLAAHGHEVVALVRPGEVAVPYPTRVGDLGEPETLTAAVADDIEAVVNLATPSGDLAIDRAATAALVAALDGRALVYTSGVWVLGATGREAADENSPTRAIQIVGYRPEVEQQVLRAASAGVRAVVIRPGIVYGGGGGIPGLLTRLAAEHGAGRYVGDPQSRWPMVHRADLADLYALAVESAPAGALLHGIGEPAVSAVALAAAADLAAGGAGRVERWTDEEAAAALGAPFAEALGLDQTVLAERTRHLLGWKPSHLDAVAEIVREGKGASA